MYHPVEGIFLGNLPETHDDKDGALFNVRTTLEEIGVKDAKEFLIYTFVTTRDDSEQFQRGYYEIFTSEPSGNVQYKKFMNVATGPSVTTIDSDNLWFPMGDGNLIIKLIHPASKKRSIKNPYAGDEWSGVFLTGYRN